MAVTAYQNQRVSSGVPSQKKPITLGLTRSITEPYIGRLIITKLYNIATRYILLLLLFFTEAYHSKKKNLV